ncbi:MAG TPA: regulatory protein RecX [Anaeromyxobacter sp.]|nr:regulatory protein RecX [Anaeromyxobacter sp.]
MTATRRRAGRARSERGELPPIEAAKALSLRLLASRARTEAEIRTRLDRAEFRGQADEVLAWLRSLGYLDDAGLARARARSLLSPGRLGPREVEHRLVRAGLPPAKARAAVEEALRGEGRSPDAAERELCRILAERKARRPLETLDERARARLARFLAGRGFGGHAVASVLGIFIDGDS